MSALGNRIDSLIRNGLSVGEAISQALNEREHPEPPTWWKTNPDGSISQVDKTPELWLTEAS